VLLRWGANGDAVVYLQTKLTDLGYAPGPVDGDFRNKTQTAVKAFQNDQGLVADGVVGPLTWAAIEGAAAPAPAPVPTPPDPGPAPSFPAWPGRYFVVVTRGDDVRVWQQQMADRGWSIAVDGVYGAKSAAICLQFQTEKGLGADGVVGPVTWDAAWTAPLS
jgi:peptidoglycan hydrolase-like protein with peptidoglycan-binding domain